MQDAQESMRGIMFIVALSVLSSSICFPARARALLLRKAPIKEQTTRARYLHIYDSIGRHVGINYQTGLVDLQIPGAEYSGSQTIPQWIRVPGGNYRVQVVGFDIADTENFIVTAIETLQSPSILATFPRSFDAQVLAGSAFAATILIGESSLQNGLTNIAISASELTGPSGAIVGPQSPPSFDLAPGASTVRSLTYDIPQNAHGTFTGTITATAEGMSSGVQTSLSATLPVRLVVTPIDVTPPTTTLTIGSPQYTDAAGKKYITSATSLILAAEDNIGGTGVASTDYRICNATNYDTIYDSGWLTYTKPFNLTSLSAGNYTIAFNSTDNVGNVETTHKIDVTLFSWSYVFKDSDGRGTMLKINLAYKFFQFIAPDKEFGIKHDSKMVQLCRQVIIICYEDKDMRLGATVADDRTCLAIAYDKQTCKNYWLMAHPPVYTLTVCCKDATGKPISGASVCLNGCCKGQTDSNGKLVIANVLAGTYIVTVKKCGYKDTSSTTTVNGDTSLTLTITAQTYALTVCCKDSKGKAVLGASVYINGVYKGMTDSSGKLIITNIAAGTYTLTAKKSGCKDSSVTTAIADDKTITITMK